MPRRAGVPPWAAFFTDEQYSAFLGLVEADLASRGGGYRLDDGMVRVDGGPTGPQSFGLVNLAQICQRAPLQEWGDIVKRHFSRVIDPDPDLDALEGKIADLDAVRGLLKLRLYPADHASATETVWWPVADGLIAALVFDLPTKIRSVSRAEAARWAVEREELRRVGLAGALADGEPQRQTLEGRDGCVIEALFGDSFFTTTLALAFERFVPVEHPFGALVSLPHRHAVLFHVIEDVSVVAAVTTLLVMGHRMFAEGPGSLSPELYWWREGRLERLPSEVDDEGISFSPPPELVRMIERLGQPLS